MKKFMFVIALIAVTAGSVFAGWVKDYNEATAAVDGIASVKAGAIDGPKAIASRSTYSNAKDANPITFNGTPNSDGIVGILLDGNAPQSLSDVYFSNVNTANDFEDIYFVALVEDASVNEYLTFGIWGHNANYVAPLVGQEWFVYLNEDFLDSFVWDDEHNGPENPIFSYTFNGEDIEGIENAAVLRFSTTGPEEPEAEVPEPAAFAYAAMGLVSAFGLKRRIRK
ncbi:MAG: hypothetical protein IJT09_02765 [Abditibacteriota bacterium]|nr:hypothetical protein [Abditibacteriota bacterium]